MQQDSKERLISEFLEKLTTLTREYKLVIGGCGCCGSPFIQDIDVEKDNDDFHYNYEDELQWIFKKDPK